MPSLQLLQLTEHGRSFLASKRRYLLLASGVLVAGGTAAFLQSRLSLTRFSSLGHNNAGKDDNAKPDKLVTDEDSLKNITRKKGRLKSLHILAAVLLSEMGKMGARDLFSMVAIAMLRTALSNRLAKVQGFLFRAAFLRRVPLFIRLISENILLCFLVSSMNSTSKYVTGTLSICFRKILTKHVHAHYFKDMAYYKMLHVDGRISNPEQRIASDIPRFCSELSELVQDDLIAVTDCLLYTWRLCSYANPKYFFWILAYVLGAGTIIRRFSPAFGKLMSKEQQLEGEYQWLHSRLRTHAESIAFYGGENREEFHIQQKFKDLVKHIDVVLHDNWWFGMIQDFLMKYLGATVSVVLIIEPFFSGDLRPDASTMGRATMLSNLRYHTSVIKSLFQSLGTLSISSRRLNRVSGYAERIHELIAISRELHSDYESSLQSSRSRNHFSEADYIQFSGVKVVTPTGNILVEDLSLKVEAGSNLLIIGPNGSGKSSLFRVLGGLWPLVSGHITKPGIGSTLNKEIFYVPQRPYTIVGTLYDQLIYPLTVEQEVEPLRHSEMVELLKNVDLEHLLDRYPPEEEVNWGDELSLGEQQRLGMARLFYHKPKFAILDECTSSVTTDMEERFCAKVRDMGTSCITISHRPALVAFHDVILSLDGEGGWKVIYKRKEYPSPPAGTNVIRASETDRQSDAMVVQHAFASTDMDSTFSNPKAEFHISEVLATSPREDFESLLPVIPELQSPPRTLALRVAALFRILVPTLLGNQGAQLITVTFLVVSRTWVSDQIASLNGSTVKFVLEQDKSSFIRLIGVSILQSAVSSFIASSLRHLKVGLALGWRVHLTRHLLKNYLRNNAFYKVFHMSTGNIDADQRISHDLDKLTTHLSKLVTGMIKPSADILWFTWRMKLLTGQRGVGVLYAYMLLGLGFLRAVTPDFGYLVSREQQLNGTFRLMHERLHAHAESIAFFGGGSREKAMIDSRFRELLDHSLSLLKKKWLYGILDDFVTTQLPHNVTWALSLLYALNYKEDDLVATQGDLAHGLRFLASVVSQSFLAFGDILDLHKKFLELSGSIHRVFELEEFIDAAQSGDWATEKLSPSEELPLNGKDVISFTVDVITPTRKLLARKLTCEIVQGNSLLVTGPNGSGKSSIFRVLKGLWPIASGRIVKPSQHFSEETEYGCGIFFIPQQPYACLGTLRDQIIYPLSRDEAARMTIKLCGDDSISADTTKLLDEHLKTILENVRLNYLLEREDCGWDANLNWEDILSLGEQQRLGMARLFFHKPKFGILDQCTNATSVDVEEQLYKLAKDMGITVVTSSQRPALLPFHSRELRLIDGEGSWELRTIKQ